MRGGGARAWTLHLAVLVLLLAVQFVLPAYHHGNLARIMVLASYAVGYNILFGYTGLLSLGHALFFAAGMYGLGLAIKLGGWAAGPAIVAGLGAGLLLGLAVGALALRTSGVAFMIVTLMFAQAGYLAILYFGAFTRGDEGFVIPREARMIMWLDLADAATRYFVALALFALCLLFCLWLMRQPLGRALIAIRENEERTEMLGYDTFRLKLVAVAISGTMSAAAGAAYALLFGYVGASFAAVQYSILPLLWVLVGGAGTVLGPFLGTLFMFYLIDIASGLTTAYMMIAGVVLVMITLFARSGLLGEARRRLWGWLP
jgi:branched-chain amino acid transport system permease protein